MADEPTPNLEASAEKPEPTQPAGPPLDAGPPPASPASAEAPDSPPAPADKAAADKAAELKGKSAEGKGKEAGEKPGPGGEKTPPEGGSGTGGEAEGKKKDEKRDIFAEIMGEEGAESLKIFKAKASKHVTKGIVHIIATFNNTVVTITDTKGNSIGWSSSGKMGFKGSRKSTAYAAQVVSQDACRQAMGHGLKEAEIRVKGPGSGRESAVRAIQNIGIDVTAIKDVTPIPHNGCRPKKARRV